MSQQGEIGLPSTSLVAGRDYPNTYREFVTMFPDNEACAKYLRKLRWPDTFICPACGIKKEAWIQTRNRMVCSSWRHQTSITAKTIFDKTRTPLTTWFEAAWHMTTAKNGMSAKTLQRTLGTSYRVGWVMLQRYRVAMVRPNRRLLAGNVEVDETLVGGVKQNGKRGRGAHKSVVVIAVEVKFPKGFGRVRVRHVSAASSNSLVPFVRDMVKPGTMIYTDGWAVITIFQSTAINVKRLHFPIVVILLTLACQACTALQVCSSAGCWVPIKDHLIPNICNRT